MVNNYSNVPEETKKRVMEVVEKYHYVPHASARILAGGYSRIIGLFMVDMKRGTEGRKLSMSSYFLPFLSGVIDAANRRGYQVLVSAIGSPAGYQGVEKVFGNKTISGGIFIGQQSDKEIERINALGYKTVMIDRAWDETKRSPNGIIINPDNFAGAYDAVRYLAQLGHTRIAHVTGYAGQLATAERLDGYKKALADSGLAYDAGIVLKGDFMSDSGSAATRRLLQMKDRPTAVFYANDSMALGGMKAAQEAGLSVPEDLSVVGFDDIEAAAGAHPPLTTVRQPMQEMSASAADTLISFIEGGSSYFAHYVMPVQLIRRQSCSRPGG